MQIPKYNCRLKLDQIGFIIIGLAIRNEWCI